MKRIFKTAMFCLTALLIAAASGLASYVITLKILDKEIPDERNAAKEMQMPATEVSAEAEPTPLSGSGKENESSKFNFYTVKLEDDTLNIYVNYEQHEELLYGEKINTGDLSEEDKTLLENGVRLEGMGEVTSLTENFTS